MIITFLFQNLIPIIFILVFLWHFYEKYRLYKLWWKIRPRTLTIPFLGSIWFTLKMAPNIFTFLSDTLEANNSIIGFWLGQNFLVLSARPKDFENVLKSQENLNKTPALYSKMKTLLGDGLAVSNADRWRHNRKIMSRGFTKISLESYVADLNEKSEEFIENLRINFKPNEDILIQTYDYTLNAFCGSFLGISGKKANEKYKWGELVNELNYYTANRMMNPKYYFDFFFYKTEMGERFMQAKKKYKEFLQMLVDESNENLALIGSKEKNKVDKLLFNHIKDPEILPNDHYMDELSAFILGSTDTSSLSMSFTIVLFGVYKEMQEEIYTEIMDILGTRKEITYQDLLNFKYLERFILESLRLFPVTPIIGRILDTDVDLGDVTLPTGSDFSIFIPKIHRNPEYYPEPMRFDPNRFLPEECAKRNPYTYLSFSIGTRNCIGSKFAMLEMKIALARLIQNFKVTSNYKSAEEMEMVCTIFSKLKNGFKCTLHPR